ncbi:MAG: SUMF1/EgtB/PvdO family nonheme iron enzyme [Puniceicoccaceae bacterium]
MKATLICLLQAIFCASICLSADLATDSRKSAVLEYDELKGLEILCVKRTWPKKPNNLQDKGLLQQLGFPSNHVSTSSIQRGWHNNEIGIYNLDTGKYRRIYKPKDGRFVGQLNLHWDADKFLFTQSTETNWEIYEMNIDGSGKRKISNTPPDVDAYEPCYLPDGRIIFGSNGGMQTVPCWHGTDDRDIENLFIMNNDGSGMRRLNFDQDHDNHPFVRHNGQVIYSRWDYTGMDRTWNRPLMAMNPDGTNQRAIYGSNSYFPNGLYSIKELPGKTGQFLCVFGGYHGSYKSGRLAIFDLNKGTQEDEGLVMQISGTGKDIPIDYFDRFTVKHWPEFVTPTPVTDSVFLTSVWKRMKDKKIGIYLADVEDNVIPLFEEEGLALLEPIPIVQRPTPPAIPDRVDLTKTDATLYIQDIHAGPGLKGVPRGTVKDLRVIAYDFGYSGMAGQDKIGFMGPWDSVRIIGTTPVEEDGSAIFKVPANTAIALQPLDDEGKAVQLMRTWMTAMPGEVLSCVGCHEASNEVPIPKRTIASTKAPVELTPWYGPQRGFDFAREVQPVLNRYCVSCHNGDSALDLREEELVADYEGQFPSNHDFNRMHPEIKEIHGGKVKYTPAYEALLDYIRRPEIADTVALLDPGEYHVDTSELVQILQAGHKGVELDKESWERIITWIDLNGPCHGTWLDVFNKQIPCSPEDRRRELASIYGGPAVDPNFIPETPAYDETPVIPEEPRTVAERPIQPLRMDGSGSRKTIDLGDAGSIELVQIENSVWMATCEVTNAQFAKFDPEHTSRFYWKRRTATDPNERGVPLYLPEQPVLRVSWERAMAFCEWLSDISGSKVTLPTEEQWESACMAGSTGEFHFEGEDFSKHENLADFAFTTHGNVVPKPRPYFWMSGGVDRVHVEGADLADKRFDDGTFVTAAVGSYSPNKLGLHDMHGNVAEWTTGELPNGEKVAKGGSYIDRPERARVQARYGYPSWQSVFNVGFRICIVEKPGSGTLASN